MFPDLGLNFAALSIGADCTAFAAAWDVAIGQFFSLFGLAMPFSFQTFCNLIDFGNFSFPLPIF
jgi:hypothetical protein